jgi:predicted  nucleic acid-binding Zn-ribbon protein
MKSAPPSGLSIATTSADKLQQQLKKYKQELKKAQLETRQLRKHVMQLNEELESSEAEVKAQQEELARAAERMEKDRHRANEERDDLLDEQEEELENQKLQYEKELKEQKERYEDQLEELEERLANVENKRMQEGGDYNKELEDIIQREREAIKKVNSLKDENAKIKSTMTKLETQVSALQSKLESSALANQTASDREREAEDKLDAALSLHSRQLSLRQAREAELERTIADLGAALARSRQKEKSGTSQKASIDSNSMKEQFERAVDELETVQAQLVLESERCDALRNELHDVAKERTAEASETQARQRQHAREVADLKSTIARLQTSERYRKSEAVAVSSDADASDVFEKNSKRPKYKSRCCQNN